MRLLIFTCSCLDTSNAADSLSAECPIVSLVENSATAGNSGFHTDGLSTNNINNTKSR